MSQNYYQKEFETMSREEMKKLQSEKLVKQVKHVYENVPYYKNLMDKNGSLCKSSIPLISSGFTPFSSIRFL